MRKFLMGTLALFVLQGALWMPIQEKAASYFKQPLKFWACKDCN